MSEVPHHDGLKLTKKQIAQLLKRAKTGENSTILAHDFGISRRMVNYYKKAQGSSAVRGQPPERYRFKGKTRTLQQWAEKLSVPYSTLRNRIVSGWTVKEMLTIPRWGSRPGQKKRPTFLSLDDLMDVFLEQQAGKTLAELAKKYKVGRGYITRRLPEVRGLRLPKWGPRDSRKPSSELFKSVMAFLKKERLLTKFKKFHLAHIKDGGEKSSVS